MKERKDKRDVLGGTTVTICLAALPVVVGLGLDWFGLAFVGRGNAGCGENRSVETARLAKFFLGWGRTLGHPDVGLEVPGALEKGA
jgi:hypothetical protein